MFDEQEIFTVNQMLVNSLTLNSNKTFILNTEILFYKVLLTHYNNVIQFHKFTAMF